MNNGPGKNLQHLFRKKEGQLTFEQKQERARRENEIEEKRYQQYIDKLNKDNGIGVRKQ